MYNEKQMIIFKVEYNHKRGWGAVSNFITKYIENVQMELRDVETVTSCVFCGGLYKNYFELIRMAGQNRDRFRKINRPENIYVNKESYEYVIWLDIHYAELYDVVELQNMYLIWDAFCNVNILALLTGKDEDYYKTSHYFEVLTEGKSRFYENVFFFTENDRRMKHLQIKNIGVLGKFLPLMPINSATEYWLRQTVDRDVTEETLKRILNENKIAEVPKILEGALRSLGRNKKYFVNCDTMKCVAKLAKLNVLTFLLFCFSVGNRTEAFINVGELTDILQSISLWADGCLQLIENIIFHSKNKKGAFSFRILEGGAVYLKEKYGKNIDEYRWIEVMISDYSGCYRWDNMAETFRHNLKDTTLRNDFEGLQPVDFFTVREGAGVRDAWEKYYSEYTNLINHYGVKIFCNVVMKSGGSFAMQSFSGHLPQEGEYWRSGIPRKYTEEMSLPGTSYSMIYSMKRPGKEDSFEDFGIEEADRNEESIREFFQYDVCYVELDTGSVPESAEKKTEYIEKMASRLQNSGDDEKKGRIWAIKADGIQGNDVEIVYKALILGIMQSEYTVHAVLYECSSELVERFLDTAYLVCNNLNGQKALSDKYTQIALYTEGRYEEILIIPGSWQNTLEVNRKNNFSRETRWKDYFEKWGGLGDKQSAGVKSIPFEVLVKVDSEGTIFEHYVNTVVRRNIQGKELGCKLENTHMRLGSTIHVNHFYEAEVLFGNALFVERFSMLLVKKLMEKSVASENGLFQQDRHITLYGYTNYSEQVIFRIMQLLEGVIEDIDVDYAILERETENRGFSHVDQIRYSRLFRSREEQKNYFKSRRIICIIPIASTLKTNEKLINLFCEENGEECRGRFAHNFELILVGSEQENQYWVKEGKRIIGNEGMEIAPAPEFFVEVKLEYLEPLECEMCFPKRIIDEIPLVEVNAASTIPNQAFGILREKERKTLNADEIKKEEESISILKESMLYRHLERGENHFLMYFQTNLLFLQCRNEIREWLESIRGEIQLATDDYAVLFCPSHFSNAGFVEYVNSIVFHGAAIVLRDDVDKEYRCNFRTKYYNLRSFAEKLSEYDQQDRGGRGKLHFFYVDDAIISGRTYQRSKSLVQSIIGGYAGTVRQKYCVFDDIFVLLDRNSGSSRWQYVGVGESQKHFWAFRTLHVSSIRNHGDACVLCNLENESGILKKSAVTRGMCEYWKREEEKFSVKPVGKYLQEEMKKYERESQTEHILREMKKERAFRRMICTNNASVFLGDEYHGNDKKETLKVLLTLVLEGCGMQKKEDRAEYFLSYCKVLSRPFRVFDKAVKEAVFDFLLVLGEGTVSGKRYAEIINGSEKKDYLRDQEIFELFMRIEQFSAEYFNDEQDRRDLVLVLLKQLTELKSNFIIRVEMMNHLAEYAEGLGEKEKSEFYDNYQHLVKKLLGISSDTSKSVWFDRVLFYQKEKDSVVSAEFPQEVIELFCLENVRVYQDAYKKMYERLGNDDIKWEEYFGHDAREIKKEEVSRFGDCIEGYIKPYQFKDFITIMEQYGFYREKVLTTEGKILIAANTLLYRYIIEEFKGEFGNEQNHEEERILDKCNYIATYMDYILASQKTMIVMEIDAEYDAWEDILIERYNRLAKEKCGVIAMRLKKEYIIIGSSEHNKASDEVRDPVIISRIQQFCKNRRWKKQKYVCDFEQHIFLWELGQDSGHPVYVYSEWENPEDMPVPHEQKVKRWNRIRNVMQYYCKLNEYVFNRSNNGFFHELVATGKKLLLHSHYKAHSHTKDDIRLKQFEHVNDKEQYSEYYQSDLLTLLADLNVSDHYRNSLTKEYYIGQVSVGEAAWNSEISVYRKRENTSFYVVNSDGVTPIKIRLCYDIVFEEDCPLKEDEKILCFDYTNGERETFLLLYLVITNAAMDNRGEIEDNEVTVWISKTKQNQLRVANLIGENTEESDAEKVNSRLKMPPLGEKGGISLWSMSRYIKKIIAGIIEKRIRQTERLTVEEQKKVLPKLHDIMCRLMSKEFDMCAERKTVGGKEYFSVLMPILKEKYKEFI